MKFKIFFLLIPLLNFSQAKLDKVSFINNKVTILVPAGFVKMSDEMWTLKYHNIPRPELVLTDLDGEVNLLASLTPQSANESQLLEFKNFQLNNIKKRPDVNILSSGINIVNGKKVSYIKFISEAVDQNVFNYYFFTIYNGKVLFFSFNCIEKLEKDWEKSADEIVASLKIN